MSDPVTLLRAALADRYMIERELGRGGNAIVYLAHDPKHNRRVALKILLPELAQSVRAERFLREIQIAAQLAHPHILPIHDSGAAAGILYYVMPYVEGESLRDRLQREKHIPLADALQIAREVADALSYAHRRDVVHRDIKPENILLQEGHAVVADFGIARALTEAGGQTVTQTGIAVGTPVYMSPEQGAGSKTVDGRSDIYSLGCVVYEMLAGQPPFTGESAQEILAHHALDLAPPLRKLRADVPPGVVAVIEIALAKRPGERFATAAEFAAALNQPGESARRRVRTRRTRARRLGVTAAVIVAGLALAWRYFRAPTERSIAVMPFSSRSTDSADVYFGAGMTEDIVDALGRVEGLRVIPVSLEYLAAHPGVSAQNIGTQLHVAKVLEGSVRRVGSELRVGARLVNTDDGTLWWSESYPRELRNVFAVQQEVAEAIVGALQLKFATAETTAGARRQTRNVEAYDLYLQGRHVLASRTPEDVKQAIQVFEAAIAKDSTYALAYSGLADAYIQAAQDAAVVSKEEAYSRALAAALNAVRLNPNLAEGHTSLGRARYIAYWDIDGAESEYRRAIAANPKYALAHQWYGLLLVLRGRYDEAIRQAGITLQLDPLWPSSGAIEFNAGRVDDAIRLARATMARGLGFYQTYMYLGQECLARDRFDEALAALFESQRIGSKGGVTLATIGAVYARTGRREEALKILNDLRSRRARTFFGEAILYTALGDNDKALASLEEGAQTPMLFGVPTNLRSPLLTPLHSNPRFVALLKKVGARP